MTDFRCHTPRVPQRSTHTLAVLVQNNFLWCSKRTLDAASHEAGFPANTSVSLHFRQLAFLEDHAGQVAHEGNPKLRSLQSRGQDTYRMGISRTCVMLFLLPIIQSGIKFSFRDFQPRFHDTINSAGLMLKPLFVLVRALVPAAWMVVYRCSFCLA